MNSTIVTDYCFLLGDENQWGGASRVVLIQLFRSVIDEFNAIVGVRPDKRLFIQPTPHLTLAFPLTLVVS